MSRVYIQATSDHFDTKSDGSPRLVKCVHQDVSVLEVFIPFNSLLDSVVPLLKQYEAESGELFPFDGVKVLVHTKPFLDDSFIQQLSAHFLGTGFAVFDVKDNTRKGRYLFSDGSGHYSTDYYECIQYSTIYIALSA